MGAVDTIWVLIVSTIPGLNDISLTNVFRCLACLHFTVYLLVLVWEHISIHAINGSAWPKCFELHCDFFESRDLRTSSQIDVAF